MAKKLSFFFDRDADILYLSVGKPRPAIAKEVGDDILVRVDPKSDEVVGCTILNLTKRFDKMKRAESLHVIADLMLRSS